MATKRVERGEVNERVASGVRALRERHRWTLGDLSERLSRLGRPIHPTTLTKIERGGEEGRRVDADDLVALALALQVNPNRLLFGEGAGDEGVALTSVVSASWRDVWEWACSASDAVTGFAQVDGEKAGAFFAAECRPHRPSTTPERAERIRRHLEPVFRACDEAREAGVTVEELQYAADLYLRVARDQEAQ